MNIVVFGASGFIGSYLVPALLDLGHNIVPVGRNLKAATYYKNLGLSMLDVDVARYETFDTISDFPLDAAINLAAVIPAADKTLNAERFLKVNTIGAYNTLKFCVEHDIKTHVLTTSHFACEGHWGIWDERKERITESMGAKYLYKGDHAAYIISKVAAEEYGKHFREEYHLRSVVLRLSGVRGYGRYKTGFEYFVKCAQEGADIDVFGDAEKVWDNIYVKDVVHAIICCLLNQSANELYNLSSGIPLTLLEEVNAIADIFSPDKHRINVKNAPGIEGGIKTSYVYDVSRLKRDSGFQPKYPLNSRAMLEDYKAEMNSGKLDWLAESKESN